jgi:hypothetical protein
VPTKEYTAARNELTIRRRSISLRHEASHRQLATFHADCVLCQHCGREAIESRTAGRVQLTFELYERLLGGLKPDSEPPTAGTQ